MFDHNVLLTFESYPDLLLIVKLFCEKTNVLGNDSKNANNITPHTHYVPLVYLRSLAVSYYIQCVKYTKALRAIAGDDGGADGEGEGEAQRLQDVRKDYDFYYVCATLFECLAV